MCTRSRRAVNRPARDDPPDARAYDLPFWQYGTTLADLRVADLALEELGAR